MLPFRAALCVTCFLDQDFLVTYAINLCLLCYWTSRAQPHSLEGFHGFWCGVFLVWFCFFLFSAFWGFGIFYFFSHSEMVREVGVIIWMQLEWILCFTSFILTLCHHELTRKSPSALSAVDKIYITFISPWIPEAIRISSVIFSIAFSPCHRDQDHLS